MRTAIPAAGSRAEATFELHLRAEGIGGYLREYRFDEIRKWRFDFAWPELRFAVEIEGTTGGAGGRHQRFDGFQGDLDKYEAAMLAGWVVYRCSSAMVTSGRAVDVTRRKLQELGA